MGVAVEQGLEAYDRLIEEPWLAEMVDGIRGGFEDLKKELPFRAAHYSRFVDNRRSQKTADPESFLFQTTVDVDKEELVEPCIKRAMELNADEASPWHNMLLHADYSARGKLHLDIRMPVGMTIAETQKAYCEALGIADEYDEACTSPERIIFITDKRQEIYRSPHWHEVLSEEEVALRRQAFVKRKLDIDGKKPHPQQPHPRPLPGEGSVCQPGTQCERPSTAVQKGAPTGDCGPAVQKGATTGDCQGSSEGNIPTLPIKGEVAQSAGEGLVSQPFCLRAFDLCVKEAGLDASAMDVWGNHNWHTNLMAVLSVGLPKLMTKEQLLAVVREKLPNYSETKDCRDLIEYFYERYTADKGYMGPVLRGISARAQLAENASAPQENEVQQALAQNDKDIEDLTKSWNPPPLPKKLPRLMELLVGNYDPRFREMLLLAALPVLSAHASHFRAVYLNGKVIGPQQYVSIIGGSGSGKGNATSLYQEMVQYTLQDNDMREWEKVKENAELRDKKANAKERPAKYHPKLRLFETTSKSSILELQNNVGKNGMLLGQFSEVDGLSSAAKAAYSDISVLLRKGWDMDMHRQYYMSDTTCNTYAQMSISLLMAGTVRAMLERMFNDNNCEGGLMQRCIPVIVPKAKRTFRPPRQNFLSEAEKSERDALLIELYQKDLALGDDVKVLDLSKVNHAIGQWFDALEEKYNDGMLTEAEADLSHRCGEFMLRAAIPLVALYEKETKEIIDLCRWVADYAHYTMSLLFGPRVQKDITKSNELMSMQLDGRVTAEPLLDKLPRIFDLKQYKEARIKAGQSPDNNVLLTRYCKSGKLVRIGRGLYRKTDTNNPIDEQIFGDEAK